MLAGTGFEHGKLAKLPHAALGSALGLALGFVLKLMMGSSLGESGGYVFGALALTEVFCHILGLLSLIVNVSCMTFLATMPIPHVPIHGTFVKASRRERAWKAVLNLAVASELKKKDNI